MTYRINFYETADEDVLRWKKSGQKTIMDRITKLLKDIAEHPWWIWLVDTSGGRRYKTASLSCPKGSRRARQNRDKEVGD